MDTTLLLQWINQYGMPLVFLVLLLSWIIPKIDQWYKAYGISRGPTKEEAQDQNIRTVLETNSRISDILAECMTTFGASTATLWQYHNGGQALSGMPFLKVSATHQKAKDGQLWAPTYQNIPISLILHPSFLEDQSIYRITAHNSDPFGITGIIVTHRLKTVYVCAIYSSSNVTVACLSIEYDSDVTLKEEDLRIFERIASRVGALLEVYRYISGGQNGKQK